MLESWRFRTFSGTPLPMRGKVGGWRQKAEGEMSNVKAQSSNGTISGRAEKRALSARVEKICSRAVAHIPGANMKEFLLTIVSEAKRPQIQLSEPGGGVLGLQCSER